MSVLRVLAVADLKPDAPDDAPQSHAALSPVTSLSVAEGENSALAVSFLLEPLLQSLARPFAPFFQDFHLYFAQRARPIIIRDHWSFRKVNGCSSRMRNQLQPHHYRGSVKMLSVADLGRLFCFLCLGSLLLWLPVAGVAATG